MGTDDKRAAGTYWAIESAVTILHCRRFVREFIPERKLRDRRDVSRYFRRTPRLVGVAVVNEPHRVTKRGNAGQSLLDAESEKALRTSAIEFNS